MRHIVRANLRYPAVWRTCVGAWNPGLGQCGTVLRDQTNQGHHCTLQGMAAGGNWESRQGRSVVDFDGSDDRGRCIGFPGTSLFGTSGTSDTPCAFSGWIYLRTTNASQIMIATDSGAVVSDNFFVGTSAAGLLAMVLYDASTSDRIGVLGSTLSANTRYHIMASYDGSGTEAGLKLHLNGKLESTSSASSGTYNGIAPTQDVILGARWTGALSAAYLNGQLDDVMVFNSVLSSSMAALLAKRPGIAYETTNTDIFAATATAGTSVPVFAHHYRTLARA